jgi:hypothetical protein
MDKNIPPLTETQRRPCLLLRKLATSEDLSREEWLFLKNATPSSRDMPLEEFIARMKAELPAWIYHLLYEYQPTEEVGLWCLRNNIPID